MKKKSRNKRKHIKVGKHFHDKFQDLKTLKIKMTSRF